MPKYSFTALALDGTRVAGTQDASTLGEVHLHLAERDLLPIQVSEKKSLLQYEITKKKVKPRDLMHFSRQLGVFIRAGIPIISALEVITLEMTDKVFKPALEDIMDMLRSGSTFSAAASRHEEVFPPFYLGILRSAEVTGNLDVALDELADYLDRDIDVRQKVKSALVYPAIVLGMAVVVVLVLTLFVLPRFETFFDSFDAKLPLPTRVLLSASHFLGRWGLVIITILLASIVGAVLYFRTANGRAKRDQ
jgi:type IV pilus assembly protein PilC